MPDITAANATFMLSITTLFPAPVQLQGFAADDIFDTEEIESVEVSMGVDGKLSGGFVFKAVPQGITLQADSSSMALFDTWWGAMQFGRQVFFANGVVILPSIGTKWAMTNGLLTRYKPTPDAKKILQPRKFGITWESISPALS